MVVYLQTGQDMDIIKCKDIVYHTIIQVVSLNPILYVHL